MKERFAPIMDLLRHGRYSSSMRLAEKLMAESRMTPDDLGRLQAIICRCRIELGDHLGARSAALVAERLTRESPDLSEVRAQVLMDLTAILLYLGRYDEALQQGTALLDSGLLYGNEPARSICWRNVGVCLHHLSRFDEAIAAFHNARSLLSPEDAAAHATIRSCLVKTHVAANSLDQVPGLLAEGESYIQSNPDDVQARVAHLCDAAEYQFARGHLAAATELAEVGLTLAERYSWHRYQCRMLLGRIAMAQERYEQALRHIMTARAIAVQGRHYDLEASAAEMMYALLRCHPEAVGGESEGARRSFSAEQAPRAH